MDTGADKRLFTIDPTLAECITPLAIDSPAECNDCSIDSVQIGGGGGTNIHNLLLGLQGGSTDQYYHLSATQSQAANNANSPTAQNPFATLADTTGSYNFSDGITQNGSSVTLGGGITNNIQLDLVGDVVLSIDGQTDNGRLLIQYIADGLNQFLYLPDGSNIGMHLSGGDVNGAQISATAPDALAKVFDWYFDHQGFLMMDQIDSFGMAYQDDYFTNGSQNDRWIPDWGAVKSLTDGLNFVPYTGATGDVDLGIYHLTATTLDVPDVHISGNGSIGTVTARHRNGIAITGIENTVATFNDANAGADSPGIAFFYPFYLNYVQTAIGADTYDILVRNSTVNAHGAVQTLSLSALIASLPASGGTVTSVTGTSNRITVASSTTTPVVDIASTYAGQASIITLGTISTGVWQGTAIADTYISSASTWNAKQSAITLSVTGASGAATFIANTLNIPTYTLSGLGGISASSTDTLTNKDLTSGTNSFPTFNQNTTGSSARWTTARLLAGNSTDGSANVAFTNKFIVQGTTDTGLSGAQFLGALTTGILKNTTTTGVLSIATPGTDYVTDSSTNTFTNKSGNISQWTNDSGYVTSSGVTSISGTVSRITSSGGATPIIDIDAAYVGQSSITTLGTIGVGVWQGSLVVGQYGGTGVNNSGKTITLGGNLTTSGAFGTTLISTGTTSITLPTAGTLSTLAGSETLTNKTLTSPVINVTSDATGDIYYRSSGGLFTRLAIGSSTNVLTVTGGVPVWAASSGFNNPMTTLGDIIYGGASGIATRLAGNTATTNLFLTSVGSAGVATAPAYFDLFGTSNTFSTNQVVQKNSIATTVTDGLALLNTTASTSGATRQISPSFRLGGHLWSTTATASDRWVDWIQYVDMTSGTNSTFNSTLHWQASHSTTSTPSYSDIMTLDKTGVLTINGLAILIGGINTGGVSGTTNSNFATTGGSSFSGGGLAVSSLLFGTASTVATRTYFSGLTGNTVAAGNSYGAVIVGRQGGNIAASGTHDWFANLVVTPLGTIGGSGATLTNTASLLIDGAGTGGTNNYALAVRSGNVNIGGLTASKVVFTDASKNLTSTGIGTSSQFIMGDGSLGTIGTRPHIIFTPTTGGTVTLTNNQYNIINPAGALLALTVTLPSSPTNNDCVFIKFTQNVTTVTYSGGTVVDGITAPTAGGLIVLVYDSGTTSWY
jgi:hypothetical protein